MAKAPAPSPPPHPGVVVEHEILRALAGDEIALKVAATAFDVPIEQLLGLIRGKTNMTPVWAMRLARVLGQTRTAADWMDLQRDYDLWKAEQALGARIRELKPLSRR